MISLVHGDSQVSPCTSDINLIDGDSIFIGFDVWFYHPPLSQSDSMAFCTELPLNMNGCLPLSQQTQDIHPMLVRCWASVVDGGPALNQHWVNVSCFLCYHPRASVPLLQCERMPRSSLCAKSITVCLSKKKFIWFPSPSNVSLFH